MKLERTRQRLGIQSRSDACESKGKDRETAPVWASVEIRGASVIRGEKHGSSLTVKYRDLLNSEVRMRLE